MTRTNLGRGLVLAASLLIVACNANSAPSVLTDPKEILKAAAANAATATSFHLDLTADGTLNLDLTGTGVGSTPIKLTGTTAAGDIDIAGKATKLTFAIPGLLGLAGEVIVKDGTAYYKTTLTGALYKKQSAANAPTPSVDPSAVPKMLATLDEVARQARGRSGQGRRRRLRRQDVLDRHHPAHARGTRRAQRWQHERPRAERPADPGPDQPRGREPRPVVPGRARHEPPGRGARRPLDSPTAASSRPTSRSRTGTRPSRSPRRPADQIAP